MKILANLALITCLLCAVTTQAQRTFDAVTITTEKLTENIYMFQGAGGNIGISIGEDGVFVIDDQFAALSDKIIAAIKMLSDKPIKFLANTHHHGDHTGGNVNMAKQGATIMAHDNVRVRLELPKSDGTAAQKEALPMITFNDTMSLYLNGEKVLIFHVDNAHTDGDALLYFTQSNVLHTGDTYFQGRYPYIDLNSGGSVNGYIASAKKALMLINETTQIIPGHGKLSNKTEFQGFLDMLETLKRATEAEIAKGKTEEEVTANTSLTKTYDALGYSWNFISSEKFRGILYNSLKKDH
jgi:glyoxylase-like metal-dependent hydrolase (beta-lactamase superfamily II)